MSAVMYKAAVAASINVTGKRYCTHGRHDMPADEGQVLKTGGSPRWICNSCLAKKTAGRRPVKTACCNGDCNQGRDCPSRSK